MGHTVFLSEPNWTLSYYLSLVRSAVGDCPCPYGLIASLLALRTNRTKHTTPRKPTTICTTTGAHTTENLPCFPTSRWSGAISGHRTSLKSTQLIKRPVITREWRHRLELIRSSYPFLETVQVSACRIALLRCSGYCISHGHYGNDYWRQLGGGEWNLFEVFKARSPCTSPTPMDSVV